MSGSIRSRARCVHGGTSEPPSALKISARRDAPQPFVLPMSRPEMESLAWDAIDVLLVSGDAYIDHPACGPALLGRWLVAHGFRVGIVAQPDWRTTRDIETMGRPRLFAGVTAGALDSMLAHYTAFRKKRSDDAYTPGGAAGQRPNRATLVYTSLVRGAFPGLPVVIGGIEASMRRAVHYDFWSDSIRRPILLDSKADALVYGMAERPLLEIARRLAARPGEDAPAARAWTGAPGTVHIWRDGDSPPPGIGVGNLPSHEEIVADPRRLMTATLQIERQCHQGGVALVQRVGARAIVLQPPSEPLDAAELDALHALPFTRRAHPSYRAPIPSAAMLQFSIVTHRGCAGGCSFCSLTLHQGRRIRSRGARSILDEAAALTRHPDWKGALSDVGGPTANMWGAACKADPAACARTSCLWPAICPSFQDGQDALAELLQRVAATRGVRHVRVASGVRHDLALRSPRFTRALLRDFVGGQLKLAPEHLSDRVLSLMRKPAFTAFEEFLRVFESTSPAGGSSHFVLPYLISAFPGCTEADMDELAAWLKRRGWRPQQIQCFIPTPGTVATAMYAGGIDPQGRPIHVARTDAERLRQHHRLAPGSRT